VTPAPDSSLLISPEERLAIQSVENEMRQIEGSEKVRLLHRNDLEGYILSMLEAVNGPQKDLIAPTKDSFERLIQEAENWFFECDPDSTSSEDYVSRRKSLDTSLRGLCPQYFEKLQSDVDRQEKEIETAAKEMMKNRQTEDHDTRKLPNSQRLEKAKKNKDEGNEVFKSGNLELAVQHYFKALTHTSKMFDQSQSEKEEADALNLSIHLNLAQCYIRLGTEVTYRKAVFSCTSALEIQPNNVKALYRRALAYEAIKDFDSASQDVSKALTLDSTDADLIKLRHLIDRHLVAEKEKQKRVFSKMFAS